MMNYFRIFLGVLLIFLITIHPTFGQQTSQKAHGTPERTTIEKQIDSLRSRQGESKAEIERLKAEIEKKSLIQQMFSQEVQFYTAIVVILVPLLAFVAGYLNIGSLKRRIVQALKSIQDQHGKMKLLELQVMKDAYQIQAARGFILGKLIWSIRVANELVESHSASDDFEAQFSLWSVHSQRELLPLGKENLKTYFEDNTSGELIYELYTILYKAKKSKFTQVEKWAREMIKLLDERT